MTHEDIEATKAPLMEHLIELRARLIKALIASALLSPAASSSPRPSTIS
jgi:sec-independent protein translocase protein TatC